MTTNRITLPTFSALLIAGTLLAGCGDAVFSEMEGAPVSQELAAFTKLRQSHLLRAKFLSRTKVLERYSDLASSNDFVVGIDPTLTMSRVIERYSLVDGLKITRSYRRAINGFAVHVDDPEAFLNLVETDSDIVWVEPDIKVKNAKPKRVGGKLNNLQYLPWGVERVGLDLAQVTPGGVDADVFIIDGGVAWSDLNEAGDVDLVNSNSGDEGKAHGTHVAGTAAAMDNLEGVVGVAPGARVHSYKVLNGNGNAILSDVIEAVDQITELKLADPSRPMVVNISFGADIGTTEYNSLDEAIVNSIAAGVTYVIAAGNEGIDASTITPAHVEEAITVGAYDKKDMFASFSNFGPTVDILAPGVEIESLWADNAGIAAPVLMSGTSMAAPHVAGAAALYLEAHPAASPAEVLGAILTAAKPAISGTPANTTTLTVYLAGITGYDTTGSVSEFLSDEGSRSIESLIPGKGKAKGKEKNRDKNRDKKDRD